MPAVGPFARAIPVFAALALAAGLTTAHADALDDADALMRTGDPRAALARYDAALLEDPGSNAALEGRASALAALGLWDQALLAQTELVRRAPEDATRRLDRAFLWLSAAAGGSADAEQARASALRDLDAAARLDAAPTVVARAALGQGLAALMAGDARAALDPLADATGSGARPAGAWRALGDARVALGDLAGAQTAYTAALEDDPGDGLSRLRRGIVRDRLGDRAGAGADAAQAGRALRALTPHDRPTALIALGDLRRRVGDASSAVLDYRDALALEPTSVPALYGGARALIALGRGAEAAALLDQLLAGARERRVEAEARFQRGRAKILTGDFDGAKRDLDALLELRPNDPLGLHNRALAAIGAGDLDAAVTDLGAAAALSPGNASIGYARSRALLAAGRREEGLDALLAVETGGARTSELVLHRALALEAVGRPDRAAAGHAEAAERDLDARRGEVRTLIALGAVDPQALDEAALRAAELTSVAPGDVDAAQLEAQVQVMAGRPDAALVMLDRAEALGAPAGQTAFLKARALLSVEPLTPERLDRAARALDQAVLRGGADAPALRLRAWVSERQGQLNAAKRDLDLAVEARPDDPELRFERARLLEKMDRCAEAIRDYDVGLLSRADDDAIYARGRCKIADGRIFDGVGDILYSYF